ncbi:hypothetical protein OIK40_11095 [Erythrobacter sp. sf7]|uniref:YARHG domain-containing protein n=1 Tax=Erythrobacter fulvus TaxID=2987523 RepID=A0ABT5JR72_9SPHN|nr:hypothetical protein [Erythrobacter fulvus]MDC8755184.1 hypothetical protein [Erythrobacter fulvus]
MLLAMALAAGSGYAAAQSRDDERTPGWYYLWAQCPQEPSTSEERFLCDEGFEGEQAQALAISNAFEVDGNGMAERELFAVEVARRFGFEAEVREVGPFPGFRAVDAEIVRTLKASRRIHKGLLAVTPVTLEPERLADEPNDEERRTQPAPLPPVMESFKDGNATLWRDDASRTCGLRLPDGTEVTPAYVTDLWGENGEGCPARLVEGWDIFRFDVPRSGMICGDTGVCTELYDGEGHWTGVVEETPHPLFSIDLFQDWGIIATGMRNHRLYSIPERRFLFEGWPGPAPEEESRVIITGSAIIEDRLAVTIDREYRDAKPDMGVFWLDTMTFEVMDEKAQERRRRVNADGSHDDGE